MGKLHNNNNNNNNLLRWNCNRVEETLELPINLIEEEKGEEDNNREFKPR